MYKKFRNDIIYILKNHLNALPLFDVAFRILIALIFPNVFSKNDFSFYTLFLNSIFWVQLFDLGNYSGYTLDKIINCNTKILHFGQLVATFLFTISLNLIIAIPILTFRFKDFSFLFFLSIIIISLVSLFSVIFRSFGIYLIDIKGKILYSITLFILIIFYKYKIFYIDKLDILFFIIIPYSFNLLVYFFNYNIVPINYNLKLNMFSLFKNNIFKGFNLYIMNISLLSLSLLDKFVFTKSLSKDQLSIFFLSLSVSSIHIIFQNQIYNIFYSKLLSKKSNFSSISKILLYSILMNLILTILIFVMYYIGFFKFLFPKYDFSQKWLFASEFICNMNSLIGLIFMIIVNKKISIFYPIFILFFPIMIYLFFELKLVTNLNYWLLVYLVILGLLLRKYFSIYLHEKINLTPKQNINHFI